MKILHPIRWFRERRILRSLDRRWPAAHEFGYPEALAKACEDRPFDYALRLRTGELWFFSGAVPVSRTWVSISFEDSLNYTDDLVGAVRPTPRPKFERRVDVRVSDIVWVADAPYGS